ncbi:MAG TPA: hypothetical protein VJ300_01005 [Thermoplasmata archaeon]|nr:hypothetical protein [Thermoplasmata archaeon]
METLKHWYVTPYGGTSTDLRLFQVGIRREALEANTTLNPEVDRVRVSIVGRNRVRPLALDRFFEIVALDGRRLDALRRSLHGEAVFPEGDQVVRRYEAPEIGDEILLNSVLSQRLGCLPDSATFAAILQELFRRRRTGG